MIEFQAYMEDRWFGPPWACPHEGLPSESVHIQNGEITALQKQSHIIESFALVMTEDITTTSLNVKRRK